VVTAGEQCVFAVESNRTHAAFNGVGVDLDAAVIEKARQPLPAAEAIADGLSQRGSAGELVESFLKPGLQRFDKWLGPALVRRGESADAILTPALQDGSTRVYPLPGQRRTHDMGHVISVFQIGGLTVDLDVHAAQIGNQILPLTPKEFAVLELLLMYRGLVVTKRMFLDNLYAARNEPKSRVIDLLVSRLRRKLAEATGGHYYIKTIWGLGYILPPDEKIPFSVSTVVKEPVG
jgi:DNA-binding winged helix-turn-helix (wHTH) protein